MIKNDEENVVHMESSELTTNLDVKAVTVEYDAKYKKRLTRKVDMRLVPLCAFIYLLNYLDRTNIGNGKILNQETGDSFLQKTRMSSADYSLVLTIFGVAYTLFDIPANWIMKRYVRPSRWLGFLMLSWGILTLGFAWVKNLHTVIVLRFLIGVFEAGFFPGKHSSKITYRHVANIFSSSYCVPNHLLVYPRTTIPSHCFRSRICISRWSLRRHYWIWRWVHEWCRWSRRIPLAFYYRRHPHLSLCATRPSVHARLARFSEMAQ